VHSEFIVRRTEVVVNPYEAPHSSPSTSSDVAHRLRNRAQPLLYLVGGICVLAAIPMFVAGVSRGSISLLYAATTLGVGISGLWLGYRPFDNLTRVGTVLWGLLAITLILATSIRLPLHAFTLLVVGLQLLAVAPIPIRAIRQRPEIGQPSRVHSLPPSSADD
jgi:hypothetical protein